jgi:hypothetical protein
MERILSTKGDKVRKKEVPISLLPVIGQHSVFIGVASPIISITYLH